NPSRLIAGSARFQSAIKPPHDCSDHQHDDQDQNGGFEHGALSQSRPIESRSARCPALSFTILDRTAAEGAPGGCAGRYAPCPQFTSKWLIIVRAGPIRLARPR